MDAIQKQELKTLTKRFIESYYPPSKQQSDHVDQLFWQAWLVSHIGLSTDEIGKLVWKASANILDGVSDLSTEVSNLESQYPNTSIAWEQLIKIGVRVGWVQKVKQIYKQYIDSDKKPSEVIKLYPQFPL